jgi:hypothetical protein
MAYFVTVSYDLSNASWQDYQNAYADLAKMGLNHELTADSGTKVTLPNTTVAGTFTGTSASSVRDDISNRVQAAFKARGFSSKIFVAVGGDWAWGQRLT